MIKGTIKAAAKTADKGPRLSINKLAEYLEATSSRRKKILTDAKYPQNFITTLYKEPQPIILDFAAGNITKADVQKEIAKFERQATAAGKISGNENEVTKNNLAANLLKEMLVLAMPSLKDTVIAKYDERSKYLLINGVKISVQPD